MRARDVWLLVALGACAQPTPSRDAGAGARFMTPAECARFKVDLALYMCERATQFIPSTKTPPSWVPANELVIDSTYEDCLAAHLHHFSWCKENPDLENLWAK